MLIAGLIFYLLITIALGYLASKKIHNSTDFVVAGRHLPLHLCVFTTFATWFGSETILGAPAEFLEKGVIGIIEDPFGAALCLLLIGLFYARPLYKLNILTFSDFFKLKFGKKAEMLSAILMIISYFGWIAAQFVALGIALQLTLNINFTLGIAIGATLVIFYTLLGGMWAISYTDFFQSIVIIIGLGILFTVLLIQTNGIMPIFEKAPPDFFRWYPKPNFTDTMTYVAAWIGLGLGSIPQQDVFQRVTSAKTANQSAYSAYIAAALYLVIGTLPLLIILCAKHLYPDVVNQNPQEALLQVTLNHLNPILQILFFGALISAILSTASGAILAPATVLAENIIKPLKPQMADKQLLKTIKIAIILIGFISFLISLLETNIYELAREASTFGLVSLFVPLTAGLFWKKASPAGALAAMAVGLSVWLIAHFLPIEIEPLFSGLFASIISQIVFSYLYPKSK